MSVPNRIHIATVNTLAGLTLTSDVSAETAYPLTNVQSQHSGRPAVWDMSGDPGSLTISWSSATGYAFNCLAITGINLPADNTIQLLLYPNESQGGTPYDSTALAVTRLGTNLREQFILVFDEFTAKSGKIVIDTPSYTNDEVVIDKIFLGEAHIFEYGHEHGSRFVIEDSSAHIPKPGGGVETYIGQANRRMDLVFRGVSDSELSTVQGMLQVAKKGGDIFASADPANARGFRHARSGIYRRNNNLDFSSTFFNWNDLGISLIES